MNIHEELRLNFKYSERELANDKTALIDEKYCNAVDRNDLLEKYVEELADIILEFPSLPAEYLLLAKEYKSKLVRCANCT